LCNRAPTENPLKPVAGHSFGKRMKKPSPGRTRTKANCKGRTIRGRIILPFGHMVLMLDDAPPGRRNHGGAIQAQLLIVLAVVAAVML
jgi:hypothetical protein